MSTFSSPVSTTASRAVVIHAALDLRVEEVAVASPGPGEVAVRIERGGICGSDLHYFNHGGFGTVRLREPMVLGHEIAGRVAAVGAGVTRVRPGETVAVNPSLPCGSCRYCHQGLHNHCLDMRFYGSAMRMPHIQGGFRDQLVCTEAQAVPVPAHVPVSVAAFAEPFAVCLHALRRAGAVTGRRVLVTGCGPIGALAIIAARHAGAGEIVATDVTPGALDMARRVGADRTFDTSADPEALRPFEVDKGWFDVVFECSGNARALSGAIAAAAPRARIVQLGLGGDMTLPVNAIVAREIELVGSFRFGDEFEWAVALLASGQVDVSPLLSATLPVADAAEAFRLASDRSRAMKVQLAFA